MLNFDEKKKHGQYWSMEKLNYSGIFFLEFFEKIWDLGNFSQYVFSVKISLRCKALIFELPFFNLIFRLFCCLLLCSWNDLVSQFIFSIYMIFFYIFYICFLFPLTSFILKICWFSSIIFFYLIITTAACVVNHPLK